jgi:hypothetical protein
MANPLTIHHGTPHQFPPTAVNPLGEFNLSKMGTGEGAQAYGKGIYQAGNEAVAEGYRKDLAKGVTYKGETPRYSRTDPHALATHQVAEYMHDLKLTPAQAIQKVSEEYKDAAASLSPFTRDLTPASATHTEAIRRRQQLHLGTHMAAEKLKPEDFAHDQGHLYQSELHIHPDHMLDWDKPLHQHSQYVRDRLGNHEDLKGFESLGHRMNGEFVHGVLAGASPGQRDQATAARKLLDAGIPGIRYLDRQSRSAGQGTSNYVIFDPRTINIVKRNGLPAMIDAGADALRDHKAAVT